MCSSTQYYEDLIVQLSTWLSSESNRDFLFTHTVKIVLFQPPEASVLMWLCKIDDTLSFYGNSFIVVKVEKY